MNQKENVKLEDNYSQVCIWPACYTDGKVQEFIDLMKKEFDIRIQYLEEITTGPDIENGKPVPETGGRIDLFFAVHNDDVGKFSIPRFTVGIRWIEDVLAKGNYRSPIYPKRVFDYCCWNHENLAR